MLQALPSASSRGHVVPRVQLEFRGVEVKVLWSMGKYKSTPAVRKGQIIQEEQDFRVLLKDSYVSVSGRLAPLPSYITHLLFLALLFLYTVHERCQKCERSELESLPRK